MYTYMYMHMYIDVDIPRCTCLNYPLWGLECISKTHFELSPIAWSRRRAAECCWVCAGTLLVYGLYRDESGIQRVYKDYMRVT